MSGIEIAGLVLGAIPLLLTGTSPHSRHSRVFQCRSLHFLVLVGFPCRELRITVGMHSDNSVAAAAKDKLIAAANFLNLHQG